MKKNENRYNQSEEDDKLESRIELKNKLNFVTNQFSISRLTDSLNEHHKLSSVFPEINQPTLDLQEQPSTQPLQQLKTSHLNQFNHHHDGLTIRNIYQEKGNLQLIALQKKNEQLTQALSEQKSEVTKLKKKNDKLTNEVDKLRRQQWHYRQIIEKHQKTIQQLNNKHNMKIQQSKQSINSTISLFEDSIDSFCPQLLSPQQTVQLLQKLLKKVSKSVKMIRRLSNEGTIHQIINQIQKP